MLVLSRKVGESIVIGGVVIKVLKIQGRQIRLGIEAPSNVPIRRSELTDHPRPASRRSGKSVGCTGYFAEV